MAAYVIADIEVKDAEAYDIYRKGVEATVSKFGGRFLDLAFQLRRAFFQLLVQFPLFDRLGEVVLERLQIRERALAVGSKPVGKTT